MIIKSTNSKALYKDIDYVKVVPVNTIFTFEAEEKVNTRIAKRTPENIINYYIIVFADVRNGINVDSFVNQLFTPSGKVYK